MRLCVGRGLTPSKNSTDDNYDYSQSREEVVFGRVDII